MQPPAARAYTSRYLSAVQAATNTVSSWLMNGGNADEVPSPVAAAAEQLRDEDFCQPKQEVRTLYPLHFLSGSLFDYPYFIAAQAEGLLTSCVTYSYGQGRGCGPV